LRTFLIQRSSDVIIDVAMMCVCSAAIYNRCSTRYPSWR